MKSVSTAQSQASAVVPVNTCVQPTLLFLVDQATLPEKCRRRAGFAGAARAPFGASGDRRQASLPGCGTEHLRHRPLASRPGATSAPPTGTEFDFCPKNQNAPAPFGLLGLAFSVLPNSKRLRVQHDVKKFPGFLFRTAVSLRRFSRRTNRLAPAARRKSAPPVNDACSGSIAASRTHVCSPVFAMKPVFRPSRFSPC